MGRYSTPIQSLISRLTYHATTANPKRLLDGVKIIAIPETDVEGDTDFPSIRLFVPDMNEHFVAARGMDGKIQIKILASTSRDKGLVACMALVETVLDALQRDQNGNVAALEGCARHFDCEVKDAYPKDRSLNAPMLLHLQPNRHDAGHRAS